MKIIPTISKNQFNKILQKRKNESLHIIGAVEKEMRAIRSFVIKIPKPGASVILLYSGGIDSTVAWAVLMHVYKLRVFPLFVSQGNTQEQAQIVRYYSDFFQKRYPSLFHVPFVVKQSIVPAEFKKIYHTTQLHQEALLNLYFPLTGQLRGPFLGANTLTVWHAMYYMRYLELTDNLKIDTVFNGITSKDGIWLHGQSFTFLRLMMASLVSFTQNVNVQFISPFFEKETGFFATKKQIIHMAATLDIPLAETTSCYNNDRVNCGTCLGCLSRKKGFASAHRTDSTLYKDTVEFPRAVKMIIDNLYRVWYAGKKKVKEVIA